MLVTITKVYSNVKTTKFGEKLSVGLKVQEQTVTDINGDSHTVGDRYINAWFPKDFVFPFREGDKAELLIKERNGYLDFAIPGVGKAPAPDVSSLVERIKKLESAVFGDSAKPAEVAPEPEVADPDDF